MKGKGLVWTAICVCIFMGVVVALGAETEVRVLGGKVQAETASGSVTLNAGQKALLEQGKAPAKTFDEPLVQDLLTLNQWAIADKATCPAGTGGMMVAVHSLESDTVFKGAVLSQGRSVSFKETDTERWGPTTMPGAAKFYDMDGSLLPTRFEKIDSAANGEQLGYLYITHTKATAPNDLFPPIIMVTESQVSTYGDALVHTGPVWQLALGNETQYWLNYYEVILPESAILIDWNMPIVTVFSRGGRTAVVMRNLTGKQARGRYALSFVWPKKDNTSLKDVPLGYFSTFGVLSKIAAAQDVTLDTYADRLKQGRALEAAIESSAPEADRKQ